MAFDYITSGPPTIPAPTQPALLFDKDNDIVYVSTMPTRNNPPAWVAIGGGGSVVQVEDVPLDVADFSGAPAAPDGNVNVQFQTDGTNVSGYVPSTISAGGTQYASTDVIVQPQDYQSGYQMLGPGLTVTLPSVFDVFEGFYIFVQCSLSGSCTLIPASGEQIYGFPDINLPKLNVGQGGILIAAASRGDWEFFGNGGIPKRTPTSASASGLQGNMVWDDDFLYVCTAANTWKRTALSTW